MTNPTPKRFRLRFSVKTLVILVTLVCAYAACWGPTRSRGVVDVREPVRSTQQPTEILHVRGVRVMLPVRHPDLNESATAPLVVGIDEIDEWPGTARRYYFWFFGYVAKLPWERELPGDYDVPIIGKGISPATFQTTPPSSSPPPTR